MPLDTNQYLSVIAREPRIGWSENVSVNPDIQVRFNIPVLANLVDNALNLNQYIVLVHLATDQPCVVVPNRWDAANRILTFNPSGSLLAGGLYQVTVRKELTSAQGRGMVADVVWSFQVSASALGIPTLITPGDSTAYTQAPTLIWQGVAPTGIVNYQVQLDRDWQFGQNLLWTSSVAASGTDMLSTAIGVSLEADTAYYWRVRARVASTSGDWSEIRSFYLGSVGQASPDTTQLYQPETAFALRELLPLSAASNLPSWPLIRATFSQAVSALTVTSGSFQLWASSVDGRASSYPRQLDGTFTVLGAQVTFTPTESISGNTRYTLILTTAIASMLGDALPETVEQYFTGAYSPLYGGTIAARQELGGFVNEVVDDEVNFNLWRASIHIHELLLTRVYRIRMNATLDDVLHYTPTAVTWGMTHYAELAAAYGLLSTYYYDMLQSAGRSTALATFQYDVDVKFLAELRERMDELKKEMDAWSARFMSELVVPRVTRKGARYSPDATFNPGAYDLSYRGRPNFDRFRRDGNPEPNLPPFWSPDGRRGF